MEIQTKTLDEVQKLLAVVLKGRLDVQSSEAVKTRLHEVIEATPASVVVNLEGVHFIDSAGLSALVSGLRFARERDKDIILVGLNKQAEMVFKLTMLDQIFTIYPSLENALENLAK